MMEDSLAVVAPSETSIGPPSTTARRLIDPSVSANTHRAYAGALDADARSTVRASRHGRYRAVQE